MKFYSTERCARAASSPTVPIAGGFGPSGPGASTMYRNSIRAALVLAIAGVGAALAQDAGSPAVANAEPAPDVTPKVVHTPEGVKVKEGVQVSRFDTVSLNVEDAD